jgi:hypothetical protein
MRQVSASGSDAHALVTFGDLRLSRIAKRIFF